MFFQNFFKKSYVTFIRFFSLFVKFLFVLYLSKNISIELFGEYGYLTSLIFFFSLIIGFESGTLQARKIIDCESIYQESEIYFKLIFDTLFMWLLCSLIFLFLRLNISFYLSSLILLIALFESLNSELKKILISKNLNLFSSYIDLIRVSLWSVVFILYSNFLNSKIVELELIFLFFLIASFSSFLLILIKIKPKFNFSHLKFNFSFFKKKKEILPFFLYGLILLFYEIVGRFILKYENLEYDLGIFTFYSSFIFSISLFIWSFNVSFEHSKIMKLFSFQDYRLAYTKIKKLIMKSLVIFFVLMLFLVYFIKMTTNYFDLYQYQINFYSLILFFVVPLINILDTQFNYFLFGHKKDRVIGLISLFSILIFLTLYNIFEINSYTQVLELINISFATTLVIKIIVTIFTIKKYVNN